MKKIELTFKNIMIVLLSASGLLSLVGDLIYGSKANAEEYLFGIFMMNVSTFAFTICSIMALVSLIFMLLGKLHPIILEKIKFEEDVDQKLNERRRKNE